LDELVVSFLSFIIAQMMQDSDAPVHVVTRHSAPSVVNPIVKKVESLM